MKKSSLTLVLCLYNLCWFASPAVAQADELRVTVANLSQDLSLLTQQVKTLQLEIEALHRENAELRNELRAELGTEVAAAASSNQDTEAQVTNLANSIETLRLEYRAADETQKQQIITEISRQINALAEETQGAINTVAEAVESQPQVESRPTFHFSDDYPKTGKPYVVRSGDSLSKIAREHGSTIKHIQNANKIVNPSRDLQVGETIFIPIAQ